MERIGILHPGKSMLDYAGLSVINLSDQTLSAAETKVLSKGLGFCPSPEVPELYDIAKSIKTMGRTMRYKTFFEKLDRDLSMLRNSRRNKQNTPDF